MAISRFGESSVTTNANGNVISHLYRPAVSNESDSDKAKKLLDESSHQHELDCAQGREKAIAALKNGASSASSTGSYTAMKIQLFSSQEDEDVLAFLEQMNKLSEKSAVNKPEPESQMQTQFKKR